MSAPRRLFVSDLHLWDPEEPAFRAFDRLMADAAGHFDEVYLLGDLCEVWVGDDDDSAAARSFVSIVARTASRSRVLVMRGNRDFLFGERFERDSGALLIDDPHLVEGGILLAHGDSFCTGDTDYQQARRLLRSPEWQRDVLSRPLGERRAMAAAMRARSRAEGANKPDNIMDVCVDEIERAVRRHGANTLIHGHTHRPAIDPQPWGRRYVLGAWERCGWKLEHNDGALVLSCFPLA